MVIRPVRKIHEDTARFCRDTTPVSCLSGKLATSCSSAPNAIAVVKKRNRDSELNSHKRIRGSPRSRMTECAKPVVLEKPSDKCCSRFAASRRSGAVAASRTRRHRGASAAPVRMMNERVDWPPALRELFPTSRRSCFYS